MLFDKSKNVKMEEIREFIPVSTSSDFDSFSPHIANAERDYLIPVIGQDMYDRLQSYYDGIISGSGSGTNSGSGDGGSAHTEELADLLKLVQSAVMHLACWIGFDLLNSYVSDAGFKRQESETVKSMFKYQEENLKAYFRTNGFNGLDTVLAYLELNIEVFIEFSASEEYASLKAAFIPNTDTFNRILFINKSRLTFMRMKQHMSLIEDTEIAPLLGATSYNYVKDEMLKESPAAKVTRLIPYIQKPVAFLASALLMEESGADLTDNGLYFTSTMASGINDTQKTVSAPERVAVLVARNRNFGNAFLDQLRSYLVANATDWTTVPVSTGKLFRRDNTDKKTFWA
jgi:hypothetical protein